jgi:hypothetical protein
MKELNLQSLSSINGGSAKSIVAEIGCLGVSLSFALVNPILGAIMGIGCSIVTHYYA